MLVFSIFLATLVGAGFADDAPAGGPFGGRLAQLFEPRLAANAMRIHNLEELIEKLKGRIGEAKKVDPQRFLNEVEAKLDHLEGNHCDKHEFQCGSDGQECISDLFICDGHRDCHNGHDEDDSVCSTVPIRAGNVFSGMVHWTDCLTRYDHPAHIAITGTKRFKFFPARVGVSALVTSVYVDTHGEKHTSKFEVHGGYNFANRRLVLFPTHYERNAGHLGVACEFSHGDNERADCHLLFEASLHECAVMHATLEHSVDDHHDDDHHHDHDDHDDRPRVTHYRKDDDRPHVEHHDDDDDHPHVEHHDHY